MKVGDNCLLKDRKTGRCERAIIIKEYEHTFNVKGISGWGFFRITKDCLTNHKSRMTIREIK